MSQVWAIFKRCKPRSFNTSIWTMFTGEQHLPGLSHGIWYLRKKCASYHKRSEHDACLSLIFCVCLICYNGEFNRFPQDFPNQISTLPSITHAHHSLQTDKFHCISPSQNNKYNKKFIICRLCTLKGQKNASISWRDYSFLHYMLVLKCSSCFLLFCKKSFVINTSGTVVMLLVHHFLILSRMKLVNM